MRTTPPFRAEHVGSLLRPARLLQARAAAEGDQYRQVSGPLDFSQLKTLEDDAIADVVRLQESVGLQVVTDGEFRRRSWFQDFLLALSGTGITWVDESATISAALVQPRWLPPRTTFGAPNMMSSPADAASCAVSIVVGNSVA